jgi:hypothetical protein
MASQTALLYVSSQKQIMSLLLAKLLDGQRSRIERVILAAVIPDAEIHIRSHQSRRLRAQRKAPPLGVGAGPHSGIDVGGLWAG